MPVYGVYGGDQRLLRVLGKRLLGLDGIYASHAGTRWNWQHGDFVLADWYRETGAALPFDVLHFIEWDLILVAPLDGLYVSVPKESLGLTALTPISDLEKEWTWLRREENRREWEQLLAYVREKWAYDGVPYGCVAGAAVFPRAFLEAYAEVDPPPLCNDELRLPLFAQALGFSLADTRLRGPWRGEREHPFFHFRAPEIELETIRAELAKPDGARAFHPVRRKLDHEMIFG